jgi:DNA-binding NarL/FixJ family response regulator
MEGMGTFSFADNSRISKVRILVVEDNAQFRQFILSILGKSAVLEVVGEASDGLGAIRKTRELQPELILLDIGLPGLNGIEVAKQICALVPKPKIVFLSQESSVDIVQDALDLGAMGYVAKERAGSDLLLALEAVVQGKHYVSVGLTDHVLSDRE